MSEQKYKSFSKKQLQVLSWWHPRSAFAQYDGIICDGAVRSGKTSCMILSFVLWASATFNGGDFALCGKTISSLRRNVVTPILPTLSDLGFSVKENLSSHFLEISKNGAVNRFYIFGGRDESSAALIQGMTLSGVLLDEVALMPRSFVEQALARCSVLGAKFWFNCNPENPLHWFYTEWIKKAESKNCVYIHFLMQDNPSLSQKVLQRYEKLYSGVFYERFVLGKWVATQGLVYPEAANGAFTKAPPDTKPSACCISCDYGTVNPFSLGLWENHGGVWYRAAEFYYSSRHEGRQKTDEEYYEDLEHLAQGREVSAVIIDPSAASFIQCVRRHGKFKAVAAKNDVLDGIRCVQEAFRSGKIKISPVCISTLREFGLYRWDAGGGKDTVKKENDHAMDDIRYFVSTRLKGDGGGVIAVAAERMSFFDKE